MIKYLLRRLIQAIPTFFGITLLSYILMDLAPGDPARLLTFDSTQQRSQRTQILAERMGLNQPFHIQYIRWLLGDDWMRWDSDGDGVSDHSFLVSLDSNNDGEPDLPGTNRGILRGDFGRSFGSSKKPVMELIGTRVLATLELGTVSLLIGLIVGVPIGVWAAVRRGGWFDSTTRIIAVAFSAIPTFWLGLMLILTVGPFLNEHFGDSIGRCPVARTAAELTSACPPIYNRLHLLLLPTIVLGSGGIAVFSRYMRASMLDVIGQDYMRTAKAKGLSGRNVWFRHGARNALMPLATFLGPSITGILSGAVITETVFAWPGLGRLGFESVVALDYPMVMAFVIIGSITTLLGFILSDVLYALIDPRIRFN